MVNAKVMSSTLILTIRFFFLLLHSYYALFSLGAPRVELVVRWIPLPLLELIRKGLSIYLLFGAYSLQGYAVYETDFCSSLSFRPVLGFPFYGPEVLYKGSMQRF